jgi:hypothetical protein
MISRSKKLRQRCREKEKKTKIRSEYHPVSRVETVVTES